MACGCGGAKKRATRTTADVQAQQDATIPFRVTGTDGKILYEGTSYLSALRAKKASSGAVMTGSTA